MQVISISELKQGELYTLTGGDDYTIPFGLYKCDGYGETDGAPIPTLESAPVVHGRWIEKKNKDGKSHTVCSECGACQTIIKAYRNFCGRCGAQMDGDAV